jgi:hypothetical protein
MPRKCTFTISSKSSTVVSAILAARPTPALLIRKSKSSRPKRRPADDSREGRGYPGIGCPCLCHAGQARSFTRSG